MVHTHPLHSKIDPSVPDDRYRRILITHLRPEASLLKDSLHLMMLSVW